MEVHQLDITCVHRDIPKNLTLYAEERRHPLTPHLVVLPIKVWMTPNLVPGMPSLDLRLARVNKDPNRR
jgi:hypothetical protein